MDPGSPGVVIGLSVLVVEVLVSMFTIVFITFVILRDYHRKKKLDTKDKMEMALNVSCTILTIVVTYNEFSNILQPDLSKMSHLSPLITVFLVYSLYSCTWLIALLCFFYFIKIVPFKWVFVSRVKMRMDSIVPWQIVLVEVMSLCISLLHLLPYGTTSVPSTNSSYISSTNKPPGLMMVNDYVSSVLLTIFLAPFVSSIITILPTVVFLRCHMTKMKDTNPSGEVRQYNRAVRRWLGFVFLFSMLYMTMYFYYFSYFALYSIGHWINLILLLLFSLALYMLKILETPHWRSSWKEMTSYFTRCREPYTH